MKTVSGKNGDGFSRRRFLANTSVLGAASLLGLPRTAAAEPAPETTRLRIVKAPAICLVPEYLAEDLLRLEGFSEVEYVDVEQSGNADQLLPEPCGHFRVCPAATCFHTSMQESRSSRWPARRATSCSPTSACSHPRPQGQARCREHRPGRVGVLLHRRDGGVRGHGSAQGRRVGRTRTASTA